MKWLSAKLLQRYVVNTEKAGEIEFLCRVCPIAFNLALISHHILFWQCDPSGREVLLRTDVGKNKEAEKKSGKEDCEGTQTTR